MIKYAIFMLCCLQPLCAVWQPNLVVLNAEKLKAPKFIKYRDAFVKALEGMGCSTEKNTMLMELIYLIEPRVCVEIGVLTGASAVPTALTLRYLGQGGMLTLIDAWSPDIAIEGLAWNDPNRELFANTNMNLVYGELYRQLGIWYVGDMCKILRMHSHEAASVIEDEIDFLHIDGGYGEQVVMLDIAYYLPKVKSGGYILLSGVCLYACEQMPKLAGYGMLSNSGCTIVASVDNDDSILFRKD